jgi:hypothetical protein
VRCFTLFLPVTTMEEYKKFIPDPKEVLRGHIADPNMSREEIEETLGRIQGHLGEFFIIVFMLNSVLTK